MWVFKEYVDHALRNALYWSVYNCCGEICTFLLDAGAKVKPWSWIQVIRNPIFSLFASLYKLTQIYFHLDGGVN